MGAQSGLPAAPDPLVASVVDTHCHLDMCAADDGPTVRRCVGGCCLGRSHEGHSGRLRCARGSRWAAQVATEYDDIWAAVALHPNEAPKIHATGGPTLLEAAWREIGELAEQPQVRAIGETGMDFFRTEAAGRRSRGVLPIPHWGAKRLGRRSSSMTGTPRRCPAHPR